MEITYKEYWQEVSAVAEEIAFDAMEKADGIREDAEYLIHDSLLHETIDAHRWVIYNAYNLGVLNHSHNAEYGIDECLVDAKKAVDSGGFWMLMAQMAFCALRADVEDKIDDALDEEEQTFRFVAGWNMPGYMPDMEPEKFPTAAEAAEFIQNEMNALADDVEPEKEARYIECIAEELSFAGPEFTTPAVNGYVFWVSKL